MDAGGDGETGELLASGRALFGGREMNEVLPGSPAARLQGSEQNRLVVNEVAAAAVPPGMEGIHALLAADPNRNTVAGTSIPIRDLRADFEGVAGPALSRLADNVVDVVAAQEDQGEILAADAAAMYTACDAMRTTSKPALVVQGLFLLFAALVKLGAVACGSDDPDDAEAADADAGAYAADGGAPLGAGGAAAAAAADTDPGACAGAALPEPARAPEPVARTPAARVAPSKCGACGQSMCPACGKGGHKSSDNKRCVHNPNNTSYVPPAPGLAEAVPAVPATAKPGSGAGAGAGRDAKRPREEDAKADAEPPPATPPATPLGARRPPAVGGPTRAAQAARSRAGPGCKSTRSSANKNKFQGMF